MQTATVETATMEAVTRLSRDLRKAAEILSDAEARFLVDHYYKQQEDRIRAEAQVRSMKDSGEPNDVLKWLGDQSGTLEKQVQGALGRYVKQSAVGQWLLSIVGIGPVISAGLLAHIDITQAPTVGHIWSYAGLSPESKWEKGQKRPWNAQLKVIAYKAGESFVKFQNHEDDVYGKVYAQRKEQEWSKNLNGDFSDQATAALSRKIGKTTTAYAFYAGHVPPSYVQELFAEGKTFPQAFPKDVVFEGAGIPMLPPAHIHARARRYAVKLFLAMLHEVMYRDHYGTEPPLPYPIAILGHAHHIRAPQKP